MECPKCKNTRITDAGECSRCGYKFPASDLIQDEFTGKYITVVTSESQNQSIVAEKRIKTPAVKVQNEKYAASKKRLISGLFWCIGGIAVTAITYREASSSPTGGHYVIAWGAILFGFWDIITGLYGMSDGPGEVTVDGSGSAHSDESEIRCSECNKIITGSEEDCPHCGQKFD